MRGNKARVMGFGASNMRRADNGNDGFKSRNRGSGGGANFGGGGMTPGGVDNGNSGPGSGPGGVKLPNLQDLDELRLIIERKRDQMSDLEQQLEAANERIKQLESEYSEFENRHCREIGLWEERWEGKLKEVDEVYTCLGKLRIDFKVVVGGTVGRKVEGGG